MEREGKGYFFAVGPEPIGEKIKKIAQKRGKGEGGGARTGHSHIEAFRYSRRDLGGSPARGKSPRLGGCLTGRRILGGGKKKPGKEFRKKGLQRPLKKAISGKKGDQNKKKTMADVKKGTSISFLKKKGRKDY